MALKQDAGQSGRVKMERAPMLKNLTRFLVDKVAASDKHAVPQTQPTNPTKQHLESQIKALKTRIQQQERTNAQLEEKVLARDKHRAACDAILKQKTRSLAILKSHHRDADAFIAVLNQYAQLLRSLFDLKKSLPEVSNEMLHQAVLSLCNRIEMHYFHPPSDSTYSAPPDTDVEIISEIQAMVVGKDSTAFVETFASLTKSTHSTLHETLGNQNAGGVHSGPQENEAASIASKIHQTTRAHVLRYAQVKNLQQKTRALVQAMYERAREIEAHIQEIDAGAMRPTIAYIHSSGDLEGYRAAHDEVLSYRSSLRDQVNDKRGDTDVLSQLQAEIERISKELTRKHSLIASIMEANILSRSNISVLKNRNQTVAVSRVVDPMMPLLPRLEGALTKEIRALSNVRVSPAAWDCILNGIEMELDWRCSAESMHELLQALGMPVYLAFDQIPVRILELKEELTRLTTSRNRLETDISASVDKVDSIVSSAIPSTSSEQLADGATSLGFRLKEFLAFLTDASEKYDERMDELMEHIELVDMQQAEQARDVSRKLSKLKEALVRRATRS
ncbi:hypothetical protein HDU77_006068 [Chytriomyces hyalinus]|nr:hypothetical protein HDU77_006068 [Chytriomyces hyalinus]